MIDDDQFMLVNYSEAQYQQGRQLLADFMRLCNGLYGALVSTVDGHELFYALQRDIPPAKLSTMTSAMLALGETVARESGQKLCQFVILENSDGRVVCLRVNILLMLTCISTKQSNLGMVLSTGQRMAEALAKIL